MAHLLLLLGTTLSAELRNDDSPSQIRAQSRDYLEVPVKGFLFLGFYDWTRTAGGAVIGVSLILHGDTAEAARISATVPRVDYVTWLTEYAFEVNFDSSATPDPVGGADQEFGPSRLYTSADGKVALSFDTNGLDDSAFDTWLTT